MKEILSHKFKIFEKEDTPGGLCRSIKQDGFTFDWTSEKAMSSLNSIFKSPESLAAEYNRQYSIVNK
jgi:protoporphyrinogen oxidase